MFNLALADLSAAPETAQPPCSLPRLRGSCWPASCNASKVPLGIWKRQMLSFIESSPWHHVINPAPPGPGFKDGKRNPVLGSEGGDWPPSTLQLPEHQVLLRCQQRRNKMMDRARWKILLPAVGSACRSVPLRSCFQRQAAGRIYLGDSGAHSPALAPHSHMLNHAARRPARPAAPCHHGSCACSTVNCE